MQCAAFVTMGSAATGNLFVRSLVSLITLLIDHLLVSLITLLIDHLLVSLITSLIRSHEVFNHSLVHKTDKNLMRYECTRDFREFKRMKYVAIL